MRGRSLLILLGAILLVLLELGAYKIGGAAAVLASRLWALHGLFFLGAAVLAVFRLLREELSQRRLLCGFALIGIGALIFWPIGSTDRMGISAEATQQVADGLAALGHKDLGYTDPAFLGYPSRQYLALAIPPRLLGRGIFALRLGAAILLTLGIGVFAAGLRALHDAPGGGAVAGLAVLSLFTFPYAARQLPFYDQTVLPLAFTCFAVGFLALCVARFTIARLLALVWAIAMLATGYTPGLAVWALFVVALLLQAARQRTREPREALWWGAGALWCAGVGACSFWTRIDLHGGAMTVSVSSDALERAAQTARILLFGDPAFFWSPLLMLPILVWLFTALTGRGGGAALLVAAWSLAVAFAAAQLRGYGEGPSVEFSLHRAIVVVPPLLALLALRAGPALAAALARPALVWAAAILMGAFSWHLVSGAWKTTLPSGTNEDLIADLERQREERRWTADRRFVIGLLSEQEALEHVETFAVYFWPAARVVRSDTDLRQAIAEGRDFVVYSDRGRGLPEWVEEIRDTRADVDLRGESWPLALVRASGSAPGESVETSAGPQQLERSAIAVDGRRVTVRHSPADMGLARNLFDRDPDTLLRTRSATTAIVDLEFEAPRELAAVSVMTGTMNIGLRVVLFGGAGKTQTFEETFTDAGLEPNVEVRFPARQTGIRRMRLEIANLQGGDGHIHLREIRLQE